MNRTAGLSRAALCKLAAELSLWRDGIHAADEKSVCAHFSISLDSIRAALACRSSARAVFRAEEQAASRLSARLVTRLDADYPARLLDLALPPPVLTLAGTLARFDFSSSHLACGSSEIRPGKGSEAHPGEASGGFQVPLQDLFPGLNGADAAHSAIAPAPAVAIVGSRRATPYGVEVATWLARELASRGVVVVSGFARGIDAAAHLGALAADGGVTVGVLGCGLEHDYPRGHRELGERIRRHGALLSEYPCALPPSAGNFPVRNRIIAALADITVVVEAAAQSGSLITARLALELGREVLAVPGRITDEQALGVNDLLRDGAGPVTHPADVLDRLGLAIERLPQSGGAGALETRATLRPDLPPAQLTLYAELDGLRDRAPEALASAAGLSIESVVAALLEMELGGWAVRGAGGGYRRARDRAAP
ncbi:MAG: DNA-processing protein DprA [Thermoanaerobaculia bacterium]